MGMAGGSSAKVMSQPKRRGVGGRGFQVEGTAGAKAPRWKDLDTFQALEENQCSWSVTGPNRGSMRSH